MHVARSAPGRILRTLAVSVVCLVMLFMVTLAFAPPALAEFPAATTFWAQDWTTGTYSQIQATTRYEGEHVVIYVADGFFLSDAIVASLGTSFDATVYPSVTGALGSEPNPGIDGDPRVAILVYDFLRNDVDGSFSRWDIDPDGNKPSNQREMIYLNLQAVQAEPENACALAAHEFAHLIVHYRDVMLDSSPFGSPESSWLNEGFATYAELLSGFDNRVASQLVAFTNDPDFSLTQWTGVRENYGASYSFMCYLAGREGADFVRALVEQSLDGVAGINATLQLSGSFDDFNSLFDDWIIAGFLDSRSPQAWPYYFEGLNVWARSQTLLGVTPLRGTEHVVDYGAVYLDFPSSSAASRFQAVVDGADGAPLHAALVSWDSAGLLYPSVRMFDLSAAAAGGTVNESAGYDRHTLVVWARGPIGSSPSYGFDYGGTPDPPAGVQFLDMGGDDQFYGDAAYLLTRGVISGREVPKGSGLWFFAGKENVLRSQFAKMIMLATGLHTDPIDNLHSPSFTDVRVVYEGGIPIADPYDYIEEASSLGIVNGYPDGAFRPYRAITRGQLVLMIIRGAAAAGKPLPSYNGSAKVFADVPLSHPLYREIMAAYTAGILTGSLGNDGRLYFHPYSSASRNHVAKMTANLIRCMEAYGSPEL